MIEKSITDFGKAKKITLTNSNGMETSILTYGGIIKDILVPYKERKVNVVLNYNSFSSYETDIFFIGAFVGRYANRIGNSCFTIGDNKYKIVANEGANHLHGTFSKRFFDYYFEQDSLVLTYISADMEEGFPGNLDVKIFYTLTEDNKLKIKYEAKTDKPTVINLTNHSYFNLNGDGGTVLNHKLTLDADYYTPTDEQNIPTGEILSVDDTPMDFRIEKTIGRDIDKPYKAIVLGHGYDHNYVLNNKGKLAKVATLKADKTSIEMDCFTDQCGIQIYSGNFLDKGFAKRGAVCFETQHYPDSPNKENFPTTILNPGEVFESNTIFKFLLDSNE